MYELKDKNILITGGNGFIGRAVVEILKNDRHVRAHKLFVPSKEVLNIQHRELVEQYIRKNKIQAIAHLAALVGGVGYSSKHPATQYYNNILMDLQIMEAAKNTNVEKIVLTSSTCAYPLNTSYPMVEEHMWDGLPQETNRAYGIAKRIMITQSEAYRQEFGLNSVVVVPNNAYGPGDNFDPESSHVIPSLIRKCLSGVPELVVWGDGTPTRDFLYVKDFAEGVVLGLEFLENSNPVNLGTGVETSISDLASTIVKLTDYKGKIRYDTTKPNGQPRRSVSNKLAERFLGFTPKYSLAEGLVETIVWYRESLKR